MALLRGVPALLVLACAQVGLYLVLSAIFAPRPEQVWRRRAFAAALVLLALSLPLTIVAERRSLEIPELPRRLLLEPLLALQIFCVPFLIVLGLWLSLARRWRVRTTLAVPTPLADAGASVAPLSPERRIFLARAATGLFAGTAGLAALGVEQAELEPQLTRHEVQIDGLHPDLEGLTILQLSDIHAGSLMTERRMERIAQAAAALQADVVVLTGDLLDLSARAGAPFGRAFASLHGKLGTFAVLGNHDYYAGLHSASTAVRDAGAQLLRNTGARIQRGKGSLYLGGIDDPMSGSVDPRRALRGAAPEEPRVMLAHRPGLFELCADAGAALVLSGHTHGGQLAFSPRWSLARLLGPYTMGLYTRHAGEGSPQRSQLYVHRGMGTVGAAPVRLGSPPEIALLTLRGS